MDTRQDRLPGVTELGRCAFGGVLMGLANLVPGISGGTMLLAAGVYPRFIGAVAAISRLRLKPGSLAVVGIVAACAALAIVLLAGPVKALVVEHRWIMYSLFIGLTLGGVPLIMRLIGKMTTSAWIGAACGLAGMTLLALAQASGAGTGGGSQDNWTLFLLGGIGAAAAMVLPGVSGGYLLLVLGLYVPVLSAIDSGKDALSEQDWSGLLSVSLSVFLPVGIGVVVGIAGVSNLLGWLLKRFEQATLGVLLGLLIGAIVGLWPFQQAVDPQVGDVIKGVVMTPELIAGLDPEDKPTAYFSPSAVQVLGSLGLVVLGFGLTMLVDRLGSGRQDAVASEPESDKPQPK